MCSVESQQLLHKILSEYGRNANADQELRRLRKQLSKTSQELEATKRREISIEAKLYEVNKKLQEYERNAAEVREKK